MTPEKQRIAIAEACGIKDPWRGCYWARGVGDYLNDLNAMREAEQTLWEKDWTSRHDFVDELARIISPTHGYHHQSGVDLLDATAAQRAEAFLRTINKWEEKNYDTRRNDSCDSAPQKRGQGGT
jgi:hypothetical protein